MEDGVITLGKGTIAALEVRMDASVPCTETMAENRLKLRVQVWAFLTFTDRPLQFGRRLICGQAGDVEPGPLLYLILN